MPGGGGGGRGGGRGARSEVDNSKFYDLLGVSKEADATEIKKAFRKAALQHHPDRGGDPEKFKEISKAHEILSDPEKRQLYDEGGEEALENGGGGGGGPGGMDIFDLFGGGMFGGGMGGRGGRKKRGEDVVFPLKITMEDLYNGTSKKLRLTKNIICAACKGKGGKNGMEATCSSCRGQGVKMSMRQIGPGMIQQVPVRCSACNGQGSQIAEKDKCTTCTGERTVKEKKTLEVFVTKGMAANEKITYKGEADEAPDTIAGDVVVVLQMTEHPVFKRQGNNLFVKRTISLIEALTGFTFHLTHLDGRVLKITPEAGMIVKPGMIKCVKDEGFPLKSNPYQRGNLYVEFDVQFPKPGELDEKALRSLSAVLPRPKPETMKKSVPPPNDDGSGNVPLQDFYEVSLVSVDMTEENSKNAEMEAEQERESYDEDDEEHHQHRAGPGCQQQ